MAAHESAKRRKNARTRVFLAFLWVLTLALPPVVVLLLPVEVQSIIAGYLTAVGVTLVIHWRVNDSRKQ
jgi:hypothetical protein